MRDRMPATTFKNKNFIQIGVNEGAKQLSINIGI